MTIKIHYQLQSFIASFTSRAEATTPTANPIHFLYPHGYFSLACFESSKSRLASDISSSCEIGADSF